MRLSRSVSHQPTLSLAMSSPDTEVRFSWEVPATGERRWIHAVVHRGGVILTEETTNPNYGGMAHLGSFTFDQVLASGVPDLSPEDAHELLTHLRSRPPATTDDPEAWDPEGVSVLARAAQRDDVEEVQRLLARGARAGATTRGGETAVHYAALALSVGSLEALVAHGAKVKDAHLRTAFWARGDDTRRAAFLRALVARGARGSAELVLRAASFGRVESLRVLIASGASVSQETIERARAEARGRGAEEVLAILESAAEPTPREPRRG